MGCPYTEQHTSVRVRSVEDPWGHTTDWRYGCGVPVHGTKHESSIQVSRPPMHGVTPLTGRTWGPRTRNKRVRFRSVDDFSTLLTGTKVLSSRLGTPASLTVVYGVGHSRQSHRNLWGWALHAVFGGSLSGRGADQERAGVVADLKKSNNPTPRVGKNPHPGACIRWASGWSFMFQRTSCLGLLNTVLMVLVGICLIRKLPGV